MLLPTHRNTMDKDNSGRVLHIILGSYHRHDIKLSKIMQMMSLKKKAVIANWEHQNTKYLHLIPHGLNICPKSTEGTILCSHKPLAQPKKRPDPWLTYRQVHDFTKAERKCVLRYFFLPLEKKQDAISSHPLFS